MGFVYKLMCLVFLFLELFGSDDFVHFSFGIIYEITGLADEFKIYS